MRILAASLALALVPAFTLTACGGDDVVPLKIGALTSLTGAVGTTFADFPTGVEARIDAYKANGGKCADRDFDIVEGDDTSTFDGALKAAQKLVEQDHVDAVLQASSFFAGASDYLTTKGGGTPVVGGGFDDAPAYDDLTKNVFSVIPPGDTLAGLTGDFMKLRDVSRMAMLSYDSPSAAQSLDAAKQSVEAADIKVAYYNDAVAFDATDVEAIANDVIDARADGFYAAMNPTTLHVVSDLRDAGYLDKMKVVLLAGGYGAELLGSATAVAAAQGVTVTTAGWAPVELGTPGVTVMSAALRKYAGSKSGIPSFAQAVGYLEADLLLHALDKAGCDADPHKLIDTIRHDDTWNGGGVLPAARNFASTTTDTSCSFYVTLEDNAFAPDKDASPLCAD